jgi:hypothetical protein
MNCINNCSVGCPNDWTTSGCPLIEARMWPDSFTVKGIAWPKGRAAFLRGCSLATSVGLAELMLKFAAEMMYLCELFDNQRRIEPVRRGVPIWKLEDNSNQSRRRNDVGVRRVFGTIEGMAAPLERCYLASTFLPKHSRSTSEHRMEAVRWPTIRVRANLSRFWSKR